MPERDSDSRQRRAAPASGPAGGDLVPAERERLIGRFGRRFRAGESLFREGEPAKEAFLLQEGRVRLLKRVRMVERSLLLLKPGDLFGETALLEANGDAGEGNETARNSTAVALSDGVALVLDQTTFRSLFENYPAIATRMFEQLIVRLRDAEDQIEIMHLRDTQFKVVSALLKLSHRATGSAELAISPVELSSRVGLDVDAVKRTVQRLREQNYLRIVGERVEIPDVEALRRLYVLLGTKDELAGDTETPADPPRGT
ncbi:MAG: Crp/Fnr family transcriptional regulator [Polyangiaceae bacterium]